MVCAGFCLGLGARSSETKGCLGPNQPDERTDPAGLPTTNARSTHLVGRRAGKALKLGDRVEVVLGERVIRLELQGFAKSRLGLLGLALLGVDTALEIGKVGMIAEN